MTDLVFFYGTLMSGFKRHGRAGLDRALMPIGRGSIKAALFDLGIDRKSTRLNSSHRT